MAIRMLKEFTTVSPRSNRDGVNGNRIENTNSTTETAMTNYNMNHGHIENETGKPGNTDNDGAAVDLTPKVERYIANIDAIRKSNRNTGLYKIGICLRSIFSLTGDTLENALQKINQEKCDPPLDKSEVKSICMSVDKSKVVPGKPGSARGSKRRNGRSVPEYRIVYAVSVPDEPVPVAVLLEKEVSVYESCRANVPQDTFTIGAMLDSFRTEETIKEQIDAIRAEPDKEKRNELKRKLPAVVFGSEPQAARNNDACRANGVLCLDFDGIPTDELESAKQAIAAVPYVYAVGLSASGGGLFALMGYEGTPDLKTLIATIQSDFCYEIDKSRSDLAGLRYISFDANLIVKDDVRPATLTEYRELLDGAAPRGEVVRCGIDVLDKILEKIEPVDWEPYETVGPNGMLNPPREREHLLRSIEQILGTANQGGTPLINHAGGIHYYTGTHYAAIGDNELRNFLIEGAIRCGVPSDTAEYHLFVDKLMKQFMIKSGRHNGGAAEPDTSYINLNNGTLFFDGRERRFEPHSPQRFIRYCLHFDYDPAATAPLWRKHLDRSLPNTDKQAYLAKCLALPFYPGKIEKCPLFHGENNTGKSTTLNVIKAIYGKENCTAESLAALTKTDTQGDYARARLDGKLVNIASDISKQLNDEGMAKLLISREEVPARAPYGHGYDIRNYARLIFAMNNLPPQFFTDAALTKRAAIIHFDRQIQPDDIDTDFTDNIIANELPGVLNWIIDGLDQLLATARLDPPPCCVEETEQLRTALDPLSAWLDARDYRKGESHYVYIFQAYPDFVEFCKADRYQTPSKRTFTKRLRDLGYKVERLNGREGTALYHTKTVSDSHSPRSPRSQGQENEGENVEQAGNEPGMSEGQENALTPDAASIPVQSQFIPPSGPANTGPGNDGNDGNEKSEHIYNGAKNE